MGEYVGVLLGCGGRDEDELNEVGDLLGCGRRRKDSHELEKLENPGGVPGWDHEEGDEEAEFRPYRSNPRQVINRSLPPSLPRSTVSLPSIRNHP